MHIMHQSKPKLKLKPCKPAAGATHWLFVEQLLLLVYALNPPALSRNEDARLRLEEATGVAQSAVRIMLEGSTVWKSAGTSVLCQAGASDLSRSQATCLCRICTPRTRIVCHWFATNYVSQINNKGTKERKGIPKHMRIHSDGTTTPSRNSFQHFYAVKV